jgi:4-hydroxy-2-oxoglutarate aldolase
VLIDNLQAMTFNLLQLAESPLDGIVILGSNGEFAYLSFQEKLQVVEKAIQVWKEAVGPDIASRRIIVGTGCESTIETIELSKQVARLGAHAVLVLPPCYYKVMAFNTFMSDLFFFMHFRCEWFVPYKGLMKFREV